MIHEFVPFTCIIHVYANVIGISHDVYNTHIKIIPSSYFENRRNGMSSTNVIPSIKFAGNKKQTSNVNKCACISINIRNDIKHYAGLNSPAYLDSIIQDDIVQNQYSSLPYPAVSLNDIQIEQTYYYGNKQNTPWKIYYAFTLENINHFLYRGSNTFRWVAT